VLAARARALAANSLVLATVAKICPERRTTLASGQRSGAGWWYGCGGLGHGSDALARMWRLRSRSDATQGVALPRARFNAGLGPSRDSPLYRGGPSLWPAADGTPDAPITAVRRSTDLWVSETEGPGPLLALSINVAKEELATVPTA
jgi:hypothetical protein